MILAALLPFALAPAIGLVAGERTPVGEVRDYKPTLVQMPDGELLLAGFQTSIRGDVSEEKIFLTRSRDGGRTWRDRQILDILGREPYLTVLPDGTLFISTHVLPKARGNDVAHTFSYLYRSTDRGKTWQGTRIDFPADAKVDPSRAMLTARNVLRLSDGTLVFGVGGGSGEEYLWRSRDGGVTWDRSLQAKFHDVDHSKIPMSLQAEAYLWQLPSGDLIELCRVVPKHFPPLPNTPLPSDELDHYERMVLFRSTNGGKDWRYEELGSYYGEMYPSLLRMQDHRLLLTFTLRAAVPPNQPPLGVHAVVGEELDHKLRFDFREDRVVLDAKTPPGASSGGGFGPTVQLADGTLVTAYSYRGSDNWPYTEVVRWKLKDDAEKKGSGQN